MRGGGVSLEGEYDVAYAWRATAILVTLTLVVMYTEGMLVPSLPTIQRDLNISTADAPGYYRFTSSWVHYPQQ